MQCTSPYNLPNGKAVPCGRCLACRISHTREWTMRILHEMESWPYSSFVTLTYDPRYLPVDNELKKAHLQQFFKRLRQDLKKEGRSCKYYACGEYGATYGRPHYHAIIFGIGPDEKELIDNNWQQGFVYLGTVTYFSAAYVAGYIMDKVSGQVTTAFDHKEKPYQTCSQGIGINWLKKNEEQVLFDLGCRIRGHIVSMPRYYVKKLEGKMLDDDLNQRLLARVAEHSAIQEARGVDIMSEADYQRLLRAQRAEELKQKRERVCRKL